MSMIPSSLKHLPPHVARELLRHVSPSTTAASANAVAAASATSASATATTKSPSQLRTVLAGCAALTMAAASMPVVLYYWVGGLNDKDEALTAPQVRRGAFLNSGTRDIGRDPDYDFSTGTHPLSAAAVNAASATATDSESSQTISSSSSTSSLPGEFLALPQRDLQKHHDKIEAFAKGRGRNN